MKYRTAAYHSDHLAIVEFDDLEKAYEYRAEIWRSLEQYAPRVAVQFFNERFPQDGWRDVPYYQSHHLEH